MTHPEVSTTNRGYVSDDELAAMHAPTYSSKEPPVDMRSHESKLADWQPQLNAPSPVVLEARKLALLEKIAKKGLIDG